MLYKPSAEPPHLWLAKSVRGLSIKAVSLIDKKCVENVIGWDWESVEQAGDVTDKKKMERILDAMDKKCYYWWQL